MMTHKTFEKGLVVLVLLAAGILFVVHSCREAEPVNKVPIVVEKKGVLNIPNDTIGKYVPVTLMEKVTKDTVAYWKKKYEAIAKLVKKTEVITKTDTVYVDSTESTEDKIFREYFLPYRVVIPNKVSKNFVTVNPLEPIESRIYVDSVQYLMDSVDVKVPITQEDCKPFMVEDSWYDHWETKVAVGVLAIVAILK